MKYSTQHMHEIVMWISYRSDSRITIFMIPIPTLIPLGLIPIQGFTKIHDSDSNSESSRKWLRFSCFHKNNLIPILIPIPASCDSDSNSNSDSSDSDFDSNPDSSDIDHDFNSESRVFRHVSLILAYILNLLMI